MKAQAALSHPRGSAAPEMSVPDQKALDALELRQQEERIEATKAADKISTFLGNHFYLTDVVPGQMFKDPIATFGAENLVNLPRFRFSRWYHSDGIVLDTFLTAEAYEDADVMARAAWCKKHKFQYAFLTPPGVSKNDRLVTLSDQLGL